jgi:hypothetical protein
MDLLIHVGVYLFVLYTPILLFILFMVVKKYPIYSPKTHWLSDLGNTKSSGSSIIIPAWIMYGFTYLFFVIGLAQILPDTIWFTIVIILLSMFLIFGFLASQIPNDIHWTLHITCVAIGHFAITLAYLILIFIISTSNLIPKYFLIFNSTLIALSIIFTFSYVELFKKVKIPLNISEIIKAEKLFLIRNITILEWVYIISIILNNFALGFVILWNLK